MRYHRLQSTTDPAKPGMAGRIFIHRPSARAGVDEGGAIREKHANAISRFGSVDASQMFAY
jgi:hypothetical protein